jgi:hypothetical protein
MHFDDIDGMLRQLSVVGCVSIKSESANNVTIIFKEHNGETHESRKPTIGDALKDIIARYNGVRLE